MTARLQASLLLPLVAADHLEQCRAILSAADHRERQQRAAVRARADLARRMALADLIGARP